jgi:hypothetical protein
MDYSDAIAAVEAGGYSWRGTAWTNVPQYLLLNSGQVYINVAGNISPYSPSGADKGANDWDSGDHPPVKT